MPPPGGSAGAGGRGALEAGEVYAVDVAALVRQATSRTNAALPCARMVSPTLAGSLALASPRPAAPADVTVAVETEPPAEESSGDGERVCRVCLCSDDVDEAGPLTELRCACRGGMRLAHAQCAERWFLSRGSGVCEICHQQAWELSLAALREAAAKRAAAAAAANAVQPTPEQRRQQRLRESWDYTESARVRLLLADVAILLGLALSALSDAVLRQTKTSPHGANVFIAFVCAALCVAAARDTLAWRLRWFTTRVGLAVITVVVSISLLGYVYNNLWGGVDFGIGAASRSGGSTADGEPVLCTEPNAACATQQQGSAGDAAGDAGRRLRFA